MFKIKSIALITTALWLSSASYIAYGSDETKLNQVEQFLVNKGRNLENQKKSDEKISEISSRFETARKKSVLNKPALKQLVDKAFAQEDAENEKRNAEKVKTNLLAVGAGEKELVVDVTPVGNETSVGEDEKDEDVDFDEDGKEPSLVEAVSSGVFAAIDQTLNVAMQGLSGQSSQVSSGDGSECNAVWAKGFVGNTKNKKSLKSLQIKTQFQGGSIGYQNLVSEDLVVGAAATILNHKIKISKVNLDTNYYIGSLYMASRMDQVLLNAAAFGGMGRGKFKDTDAKVKDTLYGAQAGLGYEIAMNEHLITPALAIKWLGMNSKWTDPDGTSKYKGSVLNGSAEVKYAYKIENGDMNIVPSVSIGANNNFSNTLKEDGQKVDIAKGPAAKFFTTLDLTAKGQIVDFGVGGKYEMAKKFNGYTATVSVLAKF